MLPPFLLRRYAALHRTGHHCGSTAMRNLLAFHTGAGLSEESVFGLSGSIWFCLVVPPLAPVEIAFGRTISLETGICEALGLPYSEQGCDDAQAWPVVRERVQTGTPVVLMGDSSKLEYFGGPRFPGHRFLLVGFDEQRGVAIVGDRRWNDLQEVSLASLARARSDPTDPLSALNLWGAPTGAWPGADEIDERASAVARKAVRTAALRMLEPDVDSTGVRGIHAFARRIRKLPAPRLAALARTGEHVIERGGNGGGFFRHMYATFLREHAGALGAFAAPLATRFHEIAKEWTRLASLLGEMAALSEPTTRAEEAARCVEGLANAERGAWEIAAARSAPGAP
jgi:hypothetical protein